MTKSSVNPSRFENLTQILPAPPLLTSADAHWSHIFFAYYQHPAAEIRQHTIPFHVLEVMDADARSHHDRQIGEHCLSYPITGGEAILCPANTHHWTSWEEHLDFTVIVFEPSFFEHVAHETVSDTQIELLPQWNVFDPLIQSIINALKVDLEAGCPAGRMYGESLCTALAVHLLRQFFITQSTPLNVHYGLPARKLKQILDYIQAHLAQDIALEDLAAVTGMSPFYFSRLFKQSMMVTPHQYVIRQRVELAKQLLKQPNYRIADIALTCGFAHQSHLSRHFRRITGISPKQFRIQ
ncbi:MAG: AraC family transcriptional regulator [Stenomitos rutilans HA7619-LM2]|jgi:AraC family transcriptional regulator|nr:AraC family transcriptional regulator [Stenomitos rutilans HA7619-LM2]